MLEFGTSDGSKHVVRSRFIGMHFHDSCNRSRVRLPRGLLRFIGCIKVRMSGPGSSELSEPCPTSAVSGVRELAANRTPPTHLSSFGHFQLLKEGHCSLRCTARSRRPLSNWRVLWHSRHHRSVALPDRSFDHKYGGFAQILGDTSRQKQANASWSDLGRFEHDNGR